MPDWDRGGDKGKGKRGYRRRRVDDDRSDSRDSRPASRRPMRDGKGRGKFGKRGRSRSPRGRGPSPKGRGRGRSSSREYDRPRGRPLPGRRDDDRDGPRRRKGDGKSDRDGWRGSPRRDRMNSARRSEEPDRDAPRRRQNGDGTAREVDYSLAEEEQEIALKRRRKLEDWFLAVELLRTWDDKKTCTAESMEQTLSKFLLEDAKQFRIEARLSTEIFLRGMLRTLWDIDRLLREMNPGDDLKRYTKSPLVLSTLRVCAYELMWTPSGTVRMAVQGAEDLMNKAGVSFKTEKDFVSSAVARMMKAFDKGHQEWDRKRQMREETKQREKAQKKGKPRGKAIGAAVGQVKRRPGADDKLPPAATKRPKLSAPGLISARADMEDEDDEDADADDVDKNASAKDDATAKNRPGAAAKKDEDDKDDTKTGPSKDKKDNDKAEVIDDDEKDDDESSESEDDDDDVCIIDDDDEPNEKSRRDAQDDADAEDDADEEAGVELLDESQLRVPEGSPEARAGPESSPDAPEGSPDADATAETNRPNGATSENGVAKEADEEVVHSDDEAADKDALLKALSKGNLDSDADGDDSQAADDNDKLKESGSEHCDDTARLLQKLAAATNGGDEEGHDDALAIVPV